MYEFIIVFFKFKQTPRKIHAWKNMIKQIHISTWKILEV